MDCLEAERLIFELDETAEQALTETQRCQVLDHLLACDTCRRLRVQEQRLTRVLTGSPGSVGQWDRRWEQKVNEDQVVADSQRPSPAGSMVTRPQVSVLTTLAVAITASLVVGVSVWSFAFSGRPNSESARNSRELFADKADLPGQMDNETWGQIIERPVVRNASYRSDPQQLQATNHVELPLGAAATIELTDAGLVTAVGPAIFELDRVAEGWKLTILQGQVEVTTRGAGKMQVASRAGVEKLDGNQPQLVGEYSRLAIETLWAAQLAPTAAEAVPTDSNQEESTKQESDQPKTVSPDQEEEPGQSDVVKLRNEGMQVFHSPGSGKDAMKRSAGVLKQVMEHADATPALVEEAAFYRVAALANAEMTQEALDSAKAIYDKQGKQTSELIWFIMAKCNWQLGNQTLARSQFKDLLKQYPKTPYGPMIATYIGAENLSQEAQDALIQSVQPRNAMNGFEPESTVPFTAKKQAKEFNAQQSGYLVVQLGLSDLNPEHRKFIDVAQRAQKFHKGQLIEFDGLDFQVLRKQIARIKPENVLFVLPPDLLDVNLQRQVFKIAPALDNDLFADFAWGYLTARDGDAIEDFWQRIEGLHKNGLPNQQWLETSVVGGGMKSTVVETEDSIPRLARESGFSGKQIYFGISSVDPEVMKFVDANLNLMESASVIAMTGNGDPQGIWLFDDSRNADPNQHWQYDPGRVGQDTKGELVRIKADRFRQLKLNSPIIWSGTCHSGACQRVFVESDIVSTFGTSPRTELYQMPSEESFCLALIDAGAGSLLVPVAANHGMSVSMECQFALSQGATLGQALKSTYDDVYLQARGVPPLAIVSRGDLIQHFNEPTMQGGGANRILIGDPSLRLFTEVESRDEQVSIADQRDNGLTVSVNWRKGFHARGWNIFADGRGGNRRMIARLDVSEFAAKLNRAAGENRLQVNATIKNDSDEAVECQAIGCLETDGQKTWLHLQATADDDSLMYENHTATFDLQW